MTITTEESIGLIKKGLELDESLRLNYINKWFNTPICKAIFAEQKLIENPMIPALFVELIADHLADLTSSKRLVMTNVFSTAPLSESEFERIFNNLPVGKKIKPEILLNAYNLHGVDFVLSLLDIVEVRQINVLLLYPATEKIEISDRRKILIKAAEGGTLILPLNYQVALSVEDLSSPNFGIETKESVVAEMREILDSGGTPAHLLDQIISGAFKPKMRTSDLTSWHVEVCQDDQTEAPNHSPVLSAFAESELSISAAESVSLINRGLELDDSVRLEYIRRLFTPSICKAIFAEQNLKENSMIPALFVELIADHLAVIGSKKAQTIIRNFSSASLSKGEFERIFNNLPISKRIEPEILLNAYNLHGVDFVLSLLEIVKARLIPIAAILPATEKIEISDRRKILIKAAEGGTLILPLNYQVALSVEDLSSPNFGIETKESVVAEMREILDSGGTPAHLLDQIISGAFKPKMRTSDLVDFLLGEVSEGAFDLIDAFNRLVYSDFQLYGKWEWIRRVILLNGHDAITHNDWEKLLDPLRELDKEEVRSAFYYLNKISPESLSSLYELKGLDTFGTGLFFEILASNVTHVAKGIKNEEIRYLEELYAKYIQVKKFVGSTPNVRVLNIFLREFAIRGCVSIIDEIGRHAIRSDLYLDVWDYSSSVLFQKQRRVAVAVSGDISAALIMFEEIQDFDFLDQLFEFYLALRARDLGKSDVGKRILLRHIDEDIPIDNRTLSVVIQSIRITDGELLELVCRKLVKNGQAFDRQVFFALCEKLRLAGAIEELEILFADLKGNTELFTVSNLSQLFFGFLDTEQPMKSLSVLKQILDLDGAEFVEYQRERIQNYDEPIVISAINEWVAAFEVVKPKRALNRRVVRNYGVERKSELPKLVKGLYESRCQLCGVALQTPTGLIAEGAHIQPLGAGHEGPDLLENMLCLCPNHHSLLDRNGWYLDDGLKAIETVSGKEIGLLRKSDDHSLSLACIRYQRRFALNSLKNAI